MKNEELQSTVGIDINLEDFSKEELISIIVAANLKNITVEQFFVDVITSECEKYKNQYEN